MKRTHKTNRRPEARARALGIPDILIEAATLDGCLDGPVWSLIDSQLSGMHDDRMIMRRAGQHADQCPLCFAALERDEYTNDASCPYCGPQMVVAMKELESFSRSNYRTQASA